MDVVMENLNGKTALITGGSRGIGRACVEALAKLKANIVVNYKSNEVEAIKTCDSIRKMENKVLLVQADVSTISEIAILINAVQKAFGSIHVLVNNAGISYPCSYEKTTEGDWDKFINTNLKSAFLMTQAVIPAMQKDGWGRIINISSTAAASGYRPLGPAYTASKAGLMGLTRYYAAALAKDGITVNTVAPSMVNTDMAVSDLKANPESWPYGRFATPEEISSVVSMLVMNEYITGQTIYVNGGRYMT